MSACSSSLTAHERPTAPSRNTYTSQDVDGGQSGDCAHTLVGYSPDQMNLNSGHSAELRKHARDAAQKHVLRRTTPNWTLLSAEAVHRSSAAHELRHGMGGVVGALRLTTVNATCGHGSGRIAGGIAARPVEMTNSANSLNDTSRSEAASVAKRHRDCLQRWTLLQYWPLL